LIEGFISVAGAAFQMDALRMVSQVPVKGALDTHYHFDHTMGNAFYGANAIPLWAHANVTKRIVESYGTMLGADKVAFLGPLEKAIKDAKTETARRHREDYLAQVTTVFNVSNSTVLALPNHPIDPAKLPMKVDLGGVTAVIESYPGHSGTDVIVRVPEQNVVYAGDLVYSNMYPDFDTQATVSRLAANVEDIRFLEQGHSLRSRTWTDLWSRRDCAPASAPRRYRRAGAEDVQSRRACGGRRGSLRNPRKIQERRNFFLGLLHRTGDSEALCGVGS
jgi:glyoxylase-like metal-dependent hydrolase (beta-lactamase superfamily II)